MEVLSHQSWRMRILAALLLQCLWRMASLPGTASLHGGDAVEQLAPLCDRDFAMITKSVHRSSQFKNFEATVRCRRVQLQDGGFEFCE